MRPGDCGIDVARGFQFLDTIASVALGHECLSGKHMRRGAFGVQLDRLLGKSQSAIEIALGDQLLRKPDPGEHMGRRDFQLALELGHAFIRMQLHQIGTIEIMDARLIRVVCHELLEFRFGVFVMLRLHIQHGPAGKMDQFDPVRRHL